MAENKPHRVQLSRRAGWRMPENTVKVDRTTEWGNPFRVDDEPSVKLLNKWEWRLSHWFAPCESVAQAVERFELCLCRDGASLHVVRAELAGKNLACWCALDKPCHADVLLAVANPNAQGVPSSQEQVREKD